MRSIGVIDLSGIYLPPLSFVVSRRLLMIAMGVALGFSSTFLMLSLLRTWGDLVPRLPRLGVRVWRDRVDGLVFDMSCFEISFLAIKMLIGSGCAELSAFKGSCGESEALSFCVMVSVM